ncbi:unnamed protein product, partial [Scytosiphon promiscuus]
DGLQWGARVGSNDAHLGPNRRRHPGKPHVSQEPAGSELPLPTSCVRGGSQDTGEEELADQSAWHRHEGHDAALFVPGRHEQGAMWGRWRRLSFSRDACLGQETCAGPAGGRGNREGGAE